MQPRTKQQSKSSDSESISMLIWRCVAESGSLFTRRALESVSFEKIHEGVTTKVKLHQFEIASLSNLLPGDVEEATTLIPSLQQKFNETEIEEILRIVTRTAAQM